MSYGLAADEVPAPVTAAEARAEARADALIHFLERYTTCTPFPQNISVVGIVWDTAFTGGLAYLASKYVFKSDDPKKWALYAGAGSAGLYLYRKATVRCPIQ